MDLELRGHVAAVVGGGAGIGLSIARAFRDEGARVVLIDRNPHVESVAEELNGGGELHAIGLVADATDPSAMERTCAHVQETFGRCDHLVFAAGAGSGKFGFPFWELEPADWPGVLNVNLTAAVNAAHAFRSALLAAPGATLLFISSVAGQIGSQTDPPYSAAKAGLINFAQCAARDFAPHGVRVNTICPGMIRTALNRSVYEAWAARQPEGERQTYEKWGTEKVRRLIPLGRWQTPEDVAAMAVFLASPRAQNITGQTINIDGGWVMHS